MSKTPAELRYAASHEWIRQEADGTITVGITDHAQDLLGDVVFVELPEVGRKVNAGQECAVVESVTHTALPSNGIGRLSPDVQALKRRIGASNSCHSFSKRQGAGSPFRMIAGCAPTLPRIFLISDR